MSTFTRFQVGITLIAISLTSCRNTSDSSGQSSITTVEELAPAHENQGCDLPNYSFAEAAKTCLLQVFVKNHSDTYYGASLFFSKSAPGVALTYIENNLQAIEDAANHGNYLSADYKALLARADFVGLVVEQNDQPKFILYAIDDINYPKLNKILDLPTDWLSDDVTEESLGFFSEDLIEKYEL